MVSRNQGTRRRTGICLLSDRKVKTEKQAGLHADGGGLYLQITVTGTSFARSWLFRYSLHGKRRAMGLGSIESVSLATARELAASYREMIAVQGTDPITERTVQKAVAKAATASVITFAQAAHQCITLKESGWKNAKHASQWRNTLEAYAFPVFGEIPVQQVDKHLIVQALAPLWLTKHETASRVRGRVETVLDWAKAAGYRSGDNPAVLKGNLDALLPAASKKDTAVEHHPALPYQEIGAFMARIRSNHPGMSGLALQWTILTACRTSETLGANWEEIDLTARTWIIPADRMKASQEHIVPLSDAALALLHQIVAALHQGQIPQTGHIFLSPGKTSPLSNIAMLNLLKRMDRSDITVHGFRSTFRDWAAELTAYPNEVVEMSLAHTISNKVEAAYRRGTLLEKRRALMAAWAGYCATAQTENTKGISTVVGIRERDSNQRFKVKA